MLQIFGLMAHNSVAKYASGQLVFSIEDEDIDLGPI